MKKLHTTFAVIFIVFSVIFPKHLNAGDEPLVYVSISPLKEVVARIAGDLVKTSVFLPPDKSPETFSPTPKDIAGLSEARVFFSIGVPFEKRLIPAIKANMKQLAVVDISTGIARRQIAGHSHNDKPGSYDSEHADPHIWLSPRLLKKQAVIITTALSEMDTDNAATYNSNLDTLLSTLDSLDLKVKAILEPFKGSAFFVFHPSFGYFADDYGLKQHAIETGGQQPSPRELAALARDLQAHGVKTVFIQPQFDKRAAAAVADAVGASLEPLDPLAENLIENIENIALKIAAALKPASEHKHQDHEH